VVDLGLVDGAFGTKHMIRIDWMLDETDTEGRRFIVRKRYTASLNEKARLRADIETWRGKKLTEKDTQSFNLEVLIGKSCQIQVVHNLSADGRTFANVQAVIPLGKGQLALGVDPSFVREAHRAQQTDSGAFADAIEAGISAAEIPF
jgi:hypothetical protein